jgi:hypothetical protein
MSLHEALPCRSRRLMQLYRLGRLLIVWDLSYNAIKVLAQQAKNSLMHSPLIRNQLYPQIAVLWLLFCT